MLALRDVEVCFGSRIVLDSVTIDVEKGRRVALVGASGGGKSTILRVALGLSPITRGDVRVLGEIASAETFPALRRRIGYVIQNGGLFPHLSASDNVTLLARTLGRSPAFIGDRLASLARLVRLPGTHLGRAPHELSGGERQRVALMRALFLEPEMLLLDEPLGALDPLVRASLQDDLLAVLKASPVTMILVTHDLAEAARLADEIAVLENGRIVQKGTRDDLERAPATPHVEALLAAARRSAA